MRVSLRRKLSFLTVLLLGIAVLVVSLVTIATFKNSLEALSDTVSSDSSSVLYKQLSNRASSFTKLLAEDLANPFYHYDMERIYRTLQAANIQPSIEKVILFDGDCKIVHDGIEEIPAYGTYYSQKEHCAERAQVDSVVTRTKDSIIASQLISVGSENLGGISIEMSLKDVEENLALLQSIFKQRQQKGLNTHLGHILLSSLAILFFSLIAVWFFAKRLTQPIESLSQHAKRVGKGDYEQALNLERDDEIGDLIASFEQMRLDLSSSTVSIEKLQKEIDEKEKAEEQRIILEEQLKRAQRMEGIGQLAAGIAHDLNNILSGIVTYPQLLMMDLPEDSKLHKPLETIHKSGERAALIVQDMLTLARANINLDEVIDPEALLRKYINSPESMKMLQTHPGVKIKLSFKSNTLNIKGSAVHLQKVFMNLINNAVDAIEGQGELTITLEQKYIDKPFGAYETIPEGEFVCYSFADSGTGIGTDDLPRVFEPFYTRKVMGRSGTGLGMAIVWNTVKDHQGFIDIESKKGEGTVVRLFFPITREEVDNELKDPNLESFVGNKEKILVVDDIEVQRQVAVSILQRLNYQVEAVSGGLEAIEYLKQKSIDLIVLDMIMDPGISGLETCKRILPNYPDTRIIIVSGYSEEKLIEDALSLGARAFLKKPYTVEALGEIVKITLSQ